MVETLTAREPSLAPDDAERIVEAVERRFEHLVAFLHALVRKPSLRGKEGGAQALVEAALQERGYSVERIRTQATHAGSEHAFSPSTIDYADSWNVVGLRRARPATGRSLALNAHVDVVPAGDPAWWATPPFEPRRDGDWLYGRGAGDMKAGLAAAIFALDAVAEAGLELCGDVQIQSVVEEEITGNGAATLLALGYRADALLSPEPTDERLVRANAGVAKFRVTLRGVGAHPRDAASGVSAIDLAIRLIAHLRRLEQAWNDERASRPHFADVENPVALTVGTIQGGEWIASLPIECSFEGRIGFYPGDEPWERAKAFEAFVAEVAVEDPAFKGQMPQVEWVGVMQPGYALQPGSAAESILAEAHGSPLVRPDELLSAYVMPCYLDATLYAVHGGIPALVYGPVAYDIHGVDERVSLPSVLRVTKTLALFAANWCGVRRAVSAQEETTMRSADQDLPRSGPRSTP